MKRLFHLTLNELIKIILRPRSTIFILILFSLLLVSGFIQYKNNQVEHGDWKEDIQTQIEKDKDELKNLRDEDAPKSYVRLVENDIQLNEHYLKTNTSPNQNSVWKFIKGNSFLLLFILIFSIIISSDIVSTEYNSGTIKLLVIRPFHRWKILLSKFLAVNILSISLIFLFLFISFLIGLILFGGFSSYNLELANINSDGSIITYTLGAYILKNTCLQIIQLTIFITISFMVSTIFKNSSIALSASLATFFGGSILANFAEKFPFLNYTLFSHLNITRFAYSKGLLSNPSFRESIVVLISYWMIMMILSFIVFQRKDIKT